MADAEDDPGDLPGTVVDEAERLTRLARNAVDPAEATAYREERDALLAEHGYTARIRDGDDGAVLVCYPDAWVDDGTVQVERIQDVSRGVERAISGPGSRPWAAVAEHNDALAEAVARQHGQPHGDTAAALAAFANNHYAKQIERLSKTELAEFCEEYFPRNAWPSDRQQERLRESIVLTFETAGATPPAALTD